MTPSPGRLPDRGARLTTLADVLREWDRTGAPLAALAEMLDEAYALALREVDRPKPTRLSGAARSRLAKLVKSTRGETVEAEHDALSPEDAEAVRRWRLACGAEPLSPEDEAAMIAAAPMSTKPGRYGSDAAMDAAVAAFERLTGTDAGRNNVRSEAGGPQRCTGPALAFAEALDGFYGIAIATPVRLQKSIARALPTVRPRRKVRGA